MSVMTGYELLLKRVKQHGTNQGHVILPVSWVSHEVAIICDNKEIIKSVKPYGNSGHIVVSGEHVGKDAHCIRLD